MELFINLSLLFFSAFLLGYFDSILSITFKLKMTFNPESKEMSNLDSNDVLKVFEFFKYDSVFKYSTLLKMATIVIISLFIFYMNIEDSFVLLVGFFIGRIFVIKSRFIDLITGQVDYYNKFNKSIFYSNIYITYFNLFLILNIYSL